jgi:hypothetical protein
MQDLVTLHARYEQTGGGFKPGFMLRERCEFEYPPGSYLRCNDWRLDLSRAPPPRTDPRSRT